MSCGRSTPRPSPSGRTGNVCLSLAEPKVVEPLQLDLRCKQVCPSMMLLLILSHSLANLRSKQGARVESGQLWAIEIVRIAGSQN